MTRSLDVHQPMASSTTLLGDQQQIERSDGLTLNKQQILTPNSNLGLSPSANSSGSMLIQSACGSCDIQSSESRGIKS